MLTLTKMVQPTNRFTLARTRGQCHSRATAPAESRDGKTTKRDSRQTSTTTDKDNNTHKERTTVRQTHNNNNNNNNETIHNVNTLVILS